jgi:general secretion pathway protein E
VAWSPDCEMSIPRELFSGDDPRLAAFLEHLLREGITDAHGIERARRVAASDGLRIDLVLNQLGLVSDEAYAVTWSATTGWPIAPGNRYPKTPCLVDELGASFLHHAKIVPLEASDATVDIAMIDPLDTFSPAAVAAKVGRSVRPFIALPKDVTAALDRLYPAEEHADAFPTGNNDVLVLDLERLKDLASDAPVIRLVQSILEQAVERRASDIHLTISRRGPLLRLRIDGLLYEAPPPPVGLYAPVVSRIKLLGGLDIAEHRLPQDGSTRAVICGREVDLRVATMPHFVGEGVVLRILDKSSLSLELNEIGVSSSFIGDLRQALAQPNGLILMTGPTGSGKTTTLYAALKSIARADRNIVTIEDPVEYQLDGITQVEINHRIGFDFATALRAVLRQDPDVILVGELRDGETASIATRAAMTGHLVLASVHTNSAASAPSRLADMGVEPYLIASTLRAVMGQRLLRRLCDSCCAPTNIDSARLQALGVQAFSKMTDAHETKGCMQCDGTGYRGRIAVTEFLSITDPVRAAIIEGVASGTLQALAREGGMRTLIDNGVELVARGQTTVAEVERVLGAS